MHAHGDDPSPVPVEQPLGQVRGQPQSLVVVHRPRLPKAPFGRRGIGRSVDPAVLLLTVTFALVATGHLFPQTWAMDAFMTGHLAPAPHLVG